MERGFTRQETLRLTGITSNKLSYLDRTGVVTPKKSGHPKHPSVIYSWEQVVQIKTISRLRENLSLQEIQQVINYLEDQNYKPSLFQMRLLFFNSKLYWVKDEDDLKAKVVELTGKSRGQFVALGLDPIGDVISDIWKEAEENHVLDFDKRAEAKPVAV